MIQSDLLDNAKFTPLSDPGKRPRKIMGVSLLILGIYYSISALFSLKYYLGPYEFTPVSEQFNYALEFLYDSHVVILISISEIIAGVLFLLDKRKAWALAMCVVMSKLLSFFFLFYPVTVSMNDVMLFFSFFIGAIYIGFLVLMLSKSFRNRYTPSKNTWMLIIGTVLIIFAESMRMLK